MKEYRTRVETDEKSSLYGRMSDELIASATFPDLSWKIFVFSEMGKLLLDQMTTRQCPEMLKHSLADGKKLESKGA